MKSLKNKSKLSAIAFALVLTVATMLVALPAVSAANPHWRFLHGAMLLLQTIL